MFLVANKYEELSNTRKQAYFISFCGSEVLEAAWALVAPQPVASGPWDVLLSKLRDHYATAPSCIARRHAFHHRNQAEGESISQFVAALRSVALYFQFRDLDNVLLDRVVCGVRDLHLQCCLLAKPDLMVQAVLDEARAAEISELSLAELQRKTSPTIFFKPVDVHYEEATPES